MVHDTEVDRMLADPRLAAVMADWTARLQAGRPYRWHRLVHATLGVINQGPDLALVTDMKWRLAQTGIETVLVSEWRREASP
jgi:hypothetical protein